MSGRALFHILTSERHSNSRVQDFRERFELKFRRQYALPRSATGTPPCVLVYRVAVTSLAVSQEASTDQISWEEVPGCQLRFPCRG